MRSSWKGTLGFGLLAIPVSLGSMISERNDTPFHQHAPDGSRIRQKRVSESTGEEVAYADIRKGYEAPDGTVIFLTDEDLDETLGKISREAEILLFTDAGNVPGLARSKSFFVKPDKGGDKAYALLASALGKSGKIAIVRFGLKQRKRLGALRPSGNGYLLLEQLEWPEDIKVADFPAPAPELSAAEEAMAATLIDSLTGDFDYSTVHDDSQARLNELIDARIAAGQAETTATSQVATPVTDIMTALTASVAAIKATTAEAA
jgi:DNA end-binding protein Ku